MNLRVLQYAAALMIPAIATSTATSYLTNKLVSRERKPSSKLSWTNIQPTHAPLRVPSNRL